MIGGLLHPVPRVAAFEILLGILVLWTTLAKGWAL